jgi:hypothetical protein
LRQAAVIPDGKVLAMTKRIWAGIASLTVLGFLLAVASPPGVGAEDPKDESKEQKEAKDKAARRQADAVKDIGMAIQLAQYGRQEKAPEMLIAAARILRKTTPAVQGKDEPEAKGGSAEKRELTSLSKAAEELLDEARKMAADDKVILELADRVAKEDVTRGAIGGPRAYTHNPGDGVNLTWTVRFRPGVPASVTVRGDGVNTLRTIVRGPAGYVYDWTGWNAGTTWVPAVWGPTTITVINQGPGAAFYTLYHN